MPLNRLSLQAMARLADDIDAVRAAMAILEDRGLVALADLTPGRPMAITLVREMPEIAHQLDPLPAEMTIAQRNFEAMYGVPGHSRADFRAEVAAVPPQDQDPDKYARAAGLVDNEGFEVEPEPTPITAEAPPAGDTGESAERAVVAAPEPAVTGAGEAEADAADPAPQPVWPARWTEEETARLIEIMAVRIERHGDGMRQAAEIAAGILGRPVEGTLYKARSIVERIEAARRAVVGQVLDRLAPETIPAGPPADRGDETAPPVADATPIGEGPEDAEGATLPADASASAVAGAGAALTPFGELCRHLQELPRKRGWTLQRDRDVLHFADLGWKPAEIALELGIPADELKPRFAMLTKGHTWKRAEVLGALEQLVKAQAA